MKIGIFDSGLGGLSVLGCALNRLKDEEFLYYADKNNVPYGTKSVQEILNFTTNAVKFMQNHGAKAVVIACNTATSAAINELRASFEIPIIGMEPAVKKAVDFKKNSALNLSSIEPLNLNESALKLEQNLQNLSHKKATKTLVIATPVTVAGKKLKELIKRIDADDEVDLLALPMLVEFAEREEFNSGAVNEYLRVQLDKFDLSCYHSVVLGCTHFNYFKDSLRKILPAHVGFMDGNDGTINKLISELERLNLRQSGTQSVEFYYSGNRVSDPAELTKIGRYLVRLEKMAHIV